MDAVMWFTVLMGLLCGLAGYFIGRDDGSTAWMAMYVDEQNKRVKAENEITHLQRVNQALEDKVLRLEGAVPLHRRLAEFELESA